MEDQLQQLIELQKEQNQLLRRYLWRLRFSLLGLLLLTTVTAVGLGVVAYQTRPPKISPMYAPVRTYVAPSPQIIYPAPSIVPAAPAGDIELREVTPRQS
jgi:hypothetical protein